MTTATKICLASALALATALPATAQQYRETQESREARAAYEAQQERYQDQRGEYAAQRDRYEDAQGEYRQTRRNYREARADYDRRLAEWERARVIYDRRYGYGSYARLYARPAWDQSYWTSYQAPPYAGYYGRNSSSSTNIRCTNDNSSTVAGGLIGALAGAVLGSNIAGRGDRTEGAVLGGIAGAVVGGAVGNANDKYRCDTAGPYFTYSETVPYREGRRRYSSSYDRSYYDRQRCRLAAAPVDAYGRDIRYVRVCPDSNNRYRITG